MKRFLIPILTLILAASFAAAGLAAPILHTVNLYLPDADAETLVMTPVEIEATPQSIVDALIAQGALPEGIAVRAFALIQAPNETEIRSGRLDLSQTFADALAASGTAGETMLMGSVVDTFLDYYGLHELSVTCKGATIETGHQIYDAPMTVFKTGETA